MEVTVTDDLKVDPNTGEILNHKGVRLDEWGREIPDPRPMAPPLGYIEQPPLHVLIRQMIQSERLAQEAQAAGAGSFEEEDDFDVEDDDYDPSSPWEENFDPAPGAPGGDDRGVGQSPAESQEEPPAPTPAEPPS